MYITAADKHHQPVQNQTATLELATPQDVLQWHCPGPNGNSKWHRGGNTENYSCRTNRTAGMP